MSSIIMTGNAVADQTKGTKTRITTNEITQRSPSIYKDKIVWTDWRNGNGDIYMFTLHGSKPTAKPPIANFSATPLSGKVPLKVKFTSASIGSPTAWKWNFGDGSPFQQRKILNISIQK